MKTNSTSSRDNLIHFPGGEGNPLPASSAQIDHAIAHPASKHYPLEDDYIAQMLETQIMPPEETHRENAKLSHYISCREEKFKEFIDRDDSMMLATSLLLSKVKKLNAYAKRIRFYLNDLEESVEDFEE